MEQAKFTVQYVLKDQFKDPDSAKYDWSKSEVKLGKRGWFICGFVNAKNSYGAYEGASQFLFWVKMNPDNTWASKWKMAPVGLLFTDCYKPSLDALSTSEGVHL